MKRIYFEPVWRMHSLYKDLVRQPPEGYEFIGPRTIWDRTFATTSWGGLRLWDFLHDSKTALDKIAPLVIARAGLQRLKKIPERTDLTYAAGHLVFRNEPWVVDLEHVATLAGDIRHFDRSTRLITKTLASRNCRRIICWTEAARRTVLSNLDCQNFDHKIEQVYIISSPKRDFTKSYDDDKVKLLFIGSANIPKEFEHKGGKEVLEAFTLLSTKYENLELVVRSDMPPRIKDKYRRMKNLKIIDTVVPWEALEQELKTADVFLLPAHSNPVKAFLDAMSYELPVITTDVWSNPEIVEDGKTGLIIKKSEKVPYYTRNFIFNGGTPEFLKAIENTDPNVVQELVEKTRILIENKELRRQMGKAGRQEVEHGKFSIERRNDKLKRIFDEATA